MTDNEFQKLMSIIDEDLKYAKIASHSKDDLIEMVLNAIDLVLRKGAEIERLTEENAKVHKIIPKMIETAKAEAVKEFAEMLKREVLIVGEVDIDSFVKEMVGDNDEQD